MDTGKHGTRIKCKRSGKWTLHHQIDEFTLLDGQNCGAKLILDLCKYLPSQLLLLFFLQPALLHSRFLPVPVLIFGLPLWKICRKTRTERLGYAVRFAFRDVHTAMVVRRQWGMDRTESDKNRKVIVSLFNTN